MNFRVIKFLVGTKDGRKVLTKFVNKGANKVRHNGLPAVLLGGSLPFLAAVTPGTKPPKSADELSGRIQVHKYCCNKS